MQRYHAIQLAEYLKTHQPRLIDVREPWEFKICRLDNSELLPMNQVPTSLKLFHESPEYVIICHHGIRSLQVINFLTHHGINNTINLDGGVDAWARDVDVTMDIY
ncbi:MAG: sulfurtransferase [Gammaproteobacteria bacterium]|nr:sulfurtransferase [Gammaproteobacteria bacterium]